MKTLSIIAILLMTSVSFGQKFSEDFTVNLAEPYQVVDGAHKEYFTVGDGSVVSVKTRGIMVTTQKMNNEGKEIERHQYEDFPKYTKVQRVVQTSNGLFYIFEAYNKSEKTFSVYSRKINTDDATMEENVKLFTTSRKVTRTGRDVYGNDPISGGGGKTGREINAGVNFAVFTSFDKSKVMIQYRLTPESRRDAINNDELGFKVYDADMGEMWGSENTMPHTEAAMNNLAYTVGSDGTAFMLSFLNEDKKFELISIREGELKNTELDVDADVLVQRLSLIEDEAGAIICAGYYARGYEFKGSFNGGFSGTMSFNADGIYCFKVNKDGGVEDSWKAEFPIDMIKKYLTERQQKNLEKREEEGKAGVEDLKMIEFFAQEDGSFIIVGEQRYVRNEFYMTGTTNVGHFSNIIISKVNADGEVAWMRKLAKNQAAALGDSYDLFFEGQLGIRYVSGNGKHYILFADNPKNNELSENEAAAAHKNGLGGFLTAYEVSDEDGSFERHSLVDLGDIDGKKAYQFKVSRICKAEDGVFFLEVYLKGKQDGIVRMELNK